MRTFKSALILVVLALMFVATGALAVSAPRTGTWYVAPPPAGNDSNDCATTTTPCATINAALNKPGFVAGDTIRVAVGTYTGTGSEVVLLNKDATLSGGWDATFTTQPGMSTIDGEGAFRGITVNGNRTVLVENLAIRNGAGGIYSQGTLILNNSIVRINVSGSGIENAGGTLTLNNSAVSNNQGRGIVNVGSATLNDSIVNSNVGAGGPGGGIANAGILTLNRCTVSNNSASFGYEGGGIANVGGGSLFLNNSTISNNSAGAGGGISNQDGSSTATLNNSTITANKSKTYYSGGGGIFVEYATLTIRNSIVANNVNEVYQGQVPAPDCSGTIVSAGYNIIESVAELGARGVERRWGRTWPLA